MICRGRCIQNVDVPCATDNVLMEVSTNLWPRIPLDPVLVVRPPCLQHGLLCSSTTRHLPDCGTACAGNHLHIGCFASVTAAIHRVHAISVAGTDKPKHPLFVQHNTCSCRAAEHYLLGKGLSYHLISLINKQSAAVLCSQRQK